MEVVKTDIDGLVVLTPRVLQDARGYFVETYKEPAFHKLGITTRFVQDNESRSARGVVRGLHYQVPPHAQAKLVRVVVGVVLDVAVDLRKGSPTYGRHAAVELSGDNKRQLFIPRGFAHGFAVLSDFCVLAYKCDDIYHAESERGLRFDDSALAIDWRIPRSEMILSEKDLHLSLLSALPAADAQIVC